MSRSSTPSRGTDPARLTRALQRAGIRIDRTKDVLSVTRVADGTTATVLLPAALPLEQKAVSQLLDFAAVRVPGVPGHVCRACATPDFHPGAIAPVGAVVATTDDFVIPAAIGTDINCGMRLLRTGLTLEAAESRREPLLSALTQVLLQGGRDVPMPSQAFRALFDDGPAACLDQVGHAGLWARSDQPRLHAELAAVIGLGELQAHSRYSPAALIDTRRDLLRDPCLGTPGSGNHFVELQVVDRVLDRHAAWHHGLRPDEIVVMIHSGSRDVGFHVGQRWMDLAREQWPAGIRHPESGLYGLAGPLAREYLLAMGVAARYAWLNRVVLAEMVRNCLANVFDEDRTALVVDVPHNVVLTEHGMNIHRKGATPARPGDLALIPGSMGDYSFVATGLGHPDWLWSCSHGAGRRVRRQEMRAVRPSTDDHAQVLPWRCITLREERRIEEAPTAYKRIGPVIDAQIGAGLIAPVARLRPWVTFKA